MGRSGCIDGMGAVSHSLTATIDRLVAKGKEAENVRELQTLTGSTWDEVFELMSSWESLTTEKKSKFCIMLSMRHALASRQGNGRAGRQLNKSPRRKVW